MSYKSDRKEQLERATREFLQRARSTEVEILRNSRVAASEWHKSLPKERRQQINVAYRDGRLSGVISLPFADWLLETFGDPTRKGAE